MVLKRPKTYAKNSYFEPEKFRNMDTFCVFSAKIRNAVTYFRNGLHVCKAVRT